MFAGFNGILLFCLVIISCGSDSEYELFYLADYQKVGESVAEKTWIEDEYDCSNFSVQFYQNCYKAGLPCRVRSGDSGGKGFSGGRHAWNSVLIDRKWVDWEPQINDIHYGHTKTSTSVGGAFSDYTYEELTRIMYELIGRTVPKNIIDTHEIDMYLYENSPFHYYFGGRRFGLDISLSGYDLAYFQANLPNNGDGKFFISSADMKVHWVYRMSNIFYVVVNIRSIDPVDGRSIIQDNVDFSEEGIFLPIDPFLWPQL